MSNLKEGRCEPCERGATPLSVEATNQFLKELKPEWKLGEGSISRRFTFRDFKESMAFVNKVAEIAEREWHHPDITIFFNTVDIKLSTHSIKGLSRNDFILAAKIDAISA